MVTSCTMYSPTKLQSPCPAHLSSMRTIKPLPSSFATTTCLVRLILFFILLEYLTFSSPACNTTSLKPVVQQLLLTHVTCISPPLPSLGQVKWPVCPSPAGWRSQSLGQSPTGCCNLSADICLRKQTAPSNAETQDAQHNASYCTKRWENCTVKAQEITVNPTERFYAFLCLY